MRRVQCRQAKTEELGAVARRVEGQDDRQAGAGLTERADGSKYGHARLRDRGQQAAPGQHDRHAVGSRVQLKRQIFDGRPHVEDVAETDACGASGTFTKRGGIGVDTDEETVWLLPRQRIRKAPVARADVDRDPVAEVGQEVSESVIRALEALAANDIHGSIIACVAFHLRSPRVHRWARRARSLGRHSTVGRTIRQHGDAIRARVETLLNGAE